MSPRARTMGVNNGTFGSCCLLLLLIVIYNHGLVEGKNLVPPNSKYSDSMYQVPTLPPSSSSGSITTKRSLSCACDPSDDSAICGSNGITYSNVCRFECAQQKVNRLRIIKTGSCGGSLTKGDFWKAESRN